MIVKTQLWGKNTRMAEMPLSLSGDLEAPSLASVPTVQARAPLDLLGTLPIQQPRGVLWLQPFRVLWVVLTIHYCLVENKSDLEKGEETGVYGGKSICRSRMDVT